MWVDIAAQESIKAGIHIVHKYIDDIRVNKLQTNVNLTITSKSIKKWPLVSIQMNTYNGESKSLFEKINFI